MKNAYYWPKETLNDTLLSLRMYLVAIQSLSLLHK